MNTTVTANVEVVTPRVAEEMLKRNVNNRTLSKKRVSMYVNDILCGTWQLNGETIVIDANGNLKDGQHRLHAILRAGKSVETVVVRGVDPTTSLYDRGRTRTASDILKFSGYDAELRNNSIVGCAKLDYYARYGKCEMSDHAVAEWIDAHEDACRVAHRACLSGTRARGNINTKLAPLMLAVIYAFESGVSEYAICKFTEVVRTGMATSDEMTAAIVLRNDLMSNTGRSIEKSRRVECLIKAERAIYDFVNGIPRRNTYAGTKKHMYMK